MVGRLRGPFPSSRGLCSLVCTARTGPSLTAWALEACSTEAGGGARPVHTGTPIEAWGWREEAVRGWVPYPYLACDLSHTPHRTYTHSLLPPSKLQLVVAS